MVLLNAPLLLQTITTQPDSSATNVPTSAQNASEASLSAIDLLVRGGWVMIPIAILLFVALVLFVERYLYIQRTSRMDPNFLYTIREMLFNGNVKGATEFCRNSSLPIARLLEKGLNRIGSPMRDIESAIENTAKVEIYNMEKNLGILSAIAAIAPMFGFLGTVLGMIRAFHNISLADNISIGIIASGIYEKMITSATGLIVGILAYVFYTILMAMIDRSVNRMEVTAIDFLDLLYKPARVS
ncbi:MAG: MotA/TolQ/ExbB proton channel family protein [Cytophagaceae bacterium]|nr:MotA/TolQ/ExbB proton channel family protein [Cytophagaceae bacterium]